MNEVTTNTPVVVTLAEPGDLRALIEMLHDDPLGARREAPNESEAAYRAAFSAIDRDPNNLLIVVRNGGPPLAMAQLTFMPSLTYQGGWRAQIEGVRVRSDQRGRGLGRQLIENAIERARQRGCRLIQLTTDRERPDSKAFYEKLGFVDSHHGMKLMLD